MNGFEGFLLGALTVGACVYFYNYSKKRNNGNNTPASNLDILKKGRPSTIKTENIDGELLFADILAWFKSQKLQKGKDVPFIANIAKEDTLKQFVDIDIPNNKVALFIGVYNSQTDEFFGQVLIADTFDKQTKETIGNEPIVVLS